MDTSRSTGNTGSIQLEVKQVSQTKRVLGIVGSYREAGTVARITNELLAAAKLTGAHTRLVRLSECNINFCTNCRQCMQPPGKRRIACSIHDDDAELLLQEIERSDVVVIGAPVNMGHVNALTQRLIERCAGFGYWPWGTRGGPQIRDSETHRKAVLISSSAAPGIMNRRLFGSDAVAALKRFSRIIGACVAKTIRVGQIVDEDGAIPDRILAQARIIGTRIGR